jgi:hypothetical protein
MYSLLILSAILVIVSPVSVYGQQLNSTNSTEIIKSKISSEIKQLEGRLESLQELRNYCYQHASDSPNPVQDLVDKAFLDESFVGETCKSVKVMIDKIQPDLQIQKLKLRDIEDKQQQEQRDIQDKQQQEQKDIQEKERLQYDAYLIENAMNNTNFNNCLNQNMSVVLCYDTFIGNRPVP